MKQLTEQQIVDNWNKLIQLIENTFDGERKEKLLEMYKYFENRMSVAPASGKGLPQCYGRWLCRACTTRYRLALKIKKLWEEDGASINFTDEELIFAAVCITT